MEGTLHKRRRLVGHVAVTRPAEHPPITRMREVPVDAAPTAQCRSCQVTLPQEYFRIDMRRKNRLDTYCNYCREIFWPTDQRRNGKRSAREVDDDITVTIPVVETPPRPSTAGLPASDDPPVEEPRHDDAPPETDLTMQALMGIIPLWELPMLTNPDISICQLTRL